MKKIKEWFEMELWYIRREGVRQYVKSPFRSHKLFGNEGVGCLYFLYSSVALLATVMVCYKNYELGKDYVSIDDEDRSVQIEAYRQMNVEPHARELFTQVVDRVDGNNDGVYDQGELVDLLFTLDYEEKIYHDASFRFGYTTAKETTLQPNLCGDFTLYNLSVSDMETYLEQ
jgi:hypothetical protein